MWLYYIDFRYVWNKSAPSKSGIAHAFLKYSLWRLFEQKNAHLKNEIWTLSLVPSFFSEHTRSTTYFIERTELFC